MDIFKPRQEIKEQLELLPEKPGVYIMKDKSGEIIYVGKAKVLRNRVRSYFRGFSAHPPKTQTLVVNIHEFDYIITDTEKEALILEANLIKKHKPRFNILLKDDKMYPFVVATINEPFPRVFMTRNPALYPDAKVYGPFVSVDGVKQSLEALHNLYKVRECTRVITGKKERPCLNYHIGRCMAPCSGEITISEYKEELDKFLLPFDGKKSQLIANLEKEMFEYAEKMQFEKAAKRRDQIKGLEGLSERQKVLQTSGLHQDYISAAILGDKACVMVFMVRFGKLENREVFSMLSGAETTVPELIEAFIPQYYQSSLDIPKEIYLSHEVEDIELLENLLSSIAEYKVHLSVPKIGEKRKTILLLEKNSLEYVEKFQKRIEREYEAKALVVSQLRESLKLAENLPIIRIEAFDISNTSGVYSVGSMVVFENGQKKKSDYRRYRIKTIEGANDYGSMQEVIYRRFREATVFPDLLFIDGGKGHVNAVEDVLKALKIYIPVVGMVKDDFHKTEDLIYLGERVGLKNYKNAFKFVYEVQEEVHRFAIEYHKSLRSREMIQSELEEIEGVGEKRKIALLKHFKSVEAVAKADLDELLQVPTMTKKVAEKIRQHFLGK